MTCPAPFCSVPVMEPDPMDEVDVPQVYTMEDAQDSELEAGNKLACKVRRITCVCVCVCVCVIEGPPYGRHLGVVGNSKCL